MPAARWIVPKEGVRRRSILPELRPIRKEFHLRHTQRTAHYRLRGESHTSRKGHDLSIQRRGQPEAARPIRGGKRIEGQVKAHVGTGARSLMNLHSHKVSTRSERRGIQSER